MFSRNFDLEEAGDSAAKQRERQSKGLEVWQRMAGARVSTGRVMMMMTEPCVRCLFIDAWASRDFLCSVCLK